MPTLAVGMWKTRDKRFMPTASVGMAPASGSLCNRNEVGARGVGRDGLCTRILVVWLVPRTLLCQTP